MNTDNSTGEAVNTDNSTGALDAITPVHCIYCGERDVSVSKSCNIFQRDPHCARCCIDQTLIYGTPAAEIALRAWRGLRLIDSERR